MMKTRNFLIIVPLLILPGFLFFSSCSHPGPDVITADPDASYQTKALFYNLDHIRVNSVLFGHQDALAYGVEWWDEPGRSDVKEVAGSYPAVYGWEIGDLELGNETNLDGVDFKKMQGWIIEGYSRGGVITIAWHINNPVTGGNSWDTTPAVAQVLPGGSHHDLFTGYLDIFADFVNGLTYKPGFFSRSHAIPVIFRPWHEMTGSWFWWGSNLCTPDEYIALWRFTVEYLRDEKGLHNLLYAYSPDRFDSPEHYLERYPGDEYVDILGYDDYWNVRDRERLPLFANGLRTVVELAEERGKIPALTETGLEAIPDTTWWTDVLLAGITTDEITRRIAYAQVWRNTARSVENRDHFYAPYAGHLSAPDFVEFARHPLILLERDLPDMYSVRK
ncbi:MAG: glycoside hydrolase family 26 protein [Rhodothermaceae bacterium]|nr:glycoside hydrolase family 26 protein [Rhodothermaceae bacterium]